MTSTTEVEPPSGAPRWYTIRQTSLMTGLPESTLRYYESIGMIPPIARDPSSGHRSYNDGDIDLLLTVSCLSATGMSLENMKEYLANQSHGSERAGRQMELMAEQGRRLDTEIERLQAQRRYVEVKVRYWQHIRDHDEHGAAQILDQGSSIIEAARCSVVKKANMERPVEDKPAEGGRQS
ncbi:MAG: MerR family transcriptional regulator [Bifidobacteriales bacterium]|nr:MerR family transcriptional regulator [Bifidobacteriales bacterium]